MLFVNRDMSRVELQPVSGGLAAVFSAGDRGREGPNQDAAALFAPGADAEVLVVADGVGGRPGGSQASSMALDALGSALEAADASGASLREAIVSGIEEANRAVSALGMGAATTLAVAKITGGRLRPFHVGDSLVAVLGQRGRRKLETVSHSPVGYAVEAGVMDEVEAMHHEDRHLISNAVGTEEMRIEIGAPVAISTRDTVLLATDGLLDNLFMREIVDLIRTGPLERSAQKLADTCLARMRGGEPGLPCKPDDVTFIAYRRRPSS
jgi:serine/threonine protein phosphatase PrpC